MNRKIYISLLVGIGAGILDVTPGILNSVNICVTLAGFSFWVITSIVIAHVSLPVKNWLKGLIVAFLLAIPGTILISLVNPSSVIPMIIITLILGPIVGHLNERYIK